MEPVHPIDMTLFGDILCSSRMRQIWSEDSLLLNRLHVEATLAEVQAELGLIPKDAAREIRSKASLEHVSVEEYARKYKEKAQDIVALVWLLSEKCEDPWGEYVHWGSTSQDIAWTSTALMMRDTLSALREELEEVQRTMLDLAERHAGTPMIGRTHGQYGLPITFGFYLVRLAEAVERHLQRLDAMQSRLAVVRMSGALGTGASYAEKAGDLEQRMAERLGLSVGVSDETEVSRDCVAEFGSVCGLIATTFEKFARDVFTLQRPEIGELAEEFRRGKQVGSSTLAHKRNPFGTAWIQGTARLIRAHSVTLQDLFVFDMRDGVRLAVEYTCLPAISCMTSALLRNVHTLLKGLDVNTDRMMRNIDASMGTISTEPVMMALARSLGRQSAHDLVYDVAISALDTDRHIGDVLRERPEVTEAISAEELESLLQPENYLGLAPAKTTAAVQRLRAELSLPDAPPAPPWDAV